MDDLIFRQAAIEALGEKPLAWTESEYEQGLQNQWEQDVDALMALPAADVRPMVHGAWKPNPRNPYWLDCTVCGYGKPERNVYNFCPNCGADMREEP